MQRSMNVPLSALAQIAIVLSLSCGGENTNNGAGGGGAAGASGTGTSGTGGSGGMLPDASACTYDDAGRLPTEAKACMTDADCVAVQTYSCCGPGVIVGLAKGAPQYRSCFQTAYPENCPPVGCASRSQTEDGQYPPLAPSDLTGVVARCIASDGALAFCATRYEPDAAARDASDDRAACFAMFHVCSTDRECCAPNRCLNITGQLACQQEGPAPEGGSCASQGQGCFGGVVCCGGLVCCGGAPCALNQGRCEADCSAGCGDR